MFEIGNYVVYGNTGICKIDDIKMMDAPGSNNKKQYYVLSPVSDHGGQSFLPVDNTRIVLRAVITKDEALTLIDQIPQIEEICLDNDKAREEKYKELAKQCSCESWVSIIKTIYLRKQERLAMGKKTTATDDRYFKLAEDSLYGELGFAMGIEKDEVQGFIKERIAG